MQKRARYTGSRLRGSSLYVTSLVAFLALYNNLINLLPEDLHDQVYVPLNLSVALLLLLSARVYGLSWSDLGLSPTQWPQGVAWGMSLGLLLTAPLFLALILPGPFTSWIDDPRIEGMSLAGLAYFVLVRIPLGTALFEEVAFRGVLYGTLETTFNLRTAVLVSSILFGIWHVTPTFNALVEGDRFDDAASLALATLGMVVLTGVGGLFFAWLRWRTKGVYGPFLTHWLINGLAAIAAYMATQ